MALGRRPQVHDVAALRHALDHIRVVVARIQAQMVQPVDDSLRTLHRDRVECFLLSGTLAPATITDDGAPRPSLRTLCLVPDLARSTWLRPVASPPSGAFVITPSMACHFQSMPTARP